MSASAAAMRVKLADTGLMHSDRRCGRRRIVIATGTPPHQAPDPQFTLMIFRPDGLGRVRYEVQVARLMLSDAKLGDLESRVYNPSVLLIREQPKKMTPPAVWPAHLIWTDSEVSNLGPATYTHAQVSDTERVRGAYQGARHALIQAVERLRFEATWRDPSGEVYYEPGIGWNDGHGRPVREVPGSW